MNHRRPGLLLSLGTGLLTVAAILTLKQVSSAWQGLVMASCYLLGFGLLLRAYWIHMNYIPPSLLDTPEGRQQLVDQAKHRRRRLEATMKPPAPES